MENKVLGFLKQYHMVSPGDRVICALSGGADSIALVWCLWMLREKLGIIVEAAHFNHNLRGEESQRDEAFVRQFCEFHDIPLHVGQGHVTPGKKGLEAAAREARYAYLRGLGGILATAHTADDNAETVLMHLVRGTGLRGLGGITPKADGLIRPMLTVTRGEVESYLEENWLHHVEDSSNAADDFLRNRIRHGIMPGLKAENPSLAENLSAMALRLRQDESLLCQLAADIPEGDVAALREAEPALRRRSLEQLLQSAGLAEPNASHIAQAEALVFSNRPSAYARFPGGVMLQRRYGRIEPAQVPRRLEPVGLSLGQAVCLSNGMTVCLEENPPENPTAWHFPVYPQGDVTIRARQSGDEITLSGGTKSLKKRMIDRKIPACAREEIPVAVDALGILGVGGFGTNLARTQGKALGLQFIDNGGDTEKSEKK